MSDIISDKDKADVEDLFEQSYRPTSKSRSVLCLIGWHSWSKWLTTNDNHILDKDAEGKYVIRVGYMIRQKRICKGCNRVDIGTISSNN